MTTRSRKTALKYIKDQKNKVNKAECTFCSIDNSHPEFIKEGKYFMVIINLYSYSYWDEQEVEDQIILVPKMHTESLRKLPLEAATEFLDVISEYESKGYSIYARSTTNVTKTVPHQHTHLIKTKGKRKKFILYLSKPFMLIMK